MIARIFNKLPLSFKGNVEREDFLKNVKAMLQTNLFYDKSEYFGHKFVVNIELWYIILTYMYVLNC